MGKKSWRLSERQRDVVVCTIRFHRNGSFPTTDARRVSVRHYPASSDDDRPRPTLSSIRREEHHLTTREALQLFEFAGLPRNQRSITRYCADGKLDAFFEPDEARYFISRASVDQLIGHLNEIKTRRKQSG
jgi:hypothetical protein